MKKQLLALFTFLLLSNYLFAQANLIEKEAWSDKPVIHKLADKYAKESAVILFDKRRIEYIDESKESLAQYFTLHKLIHINDDRGIEGFNKIYLGFSEKADVVDIKARAILPGGKIIELDKNNIKDIKEDDGNTYKIFAMDGLTKGCEVEYYYTFKRPATLFGREIVQSQSPVQFASVQLVMPDRLKFDLKTYNGAEVATDTLQGAKKITKCVFNDIPGAEEEKYAYYSANLRRVEYKLSYNDATKKGERLFTWNELAKRVYQIYSDYTEKDAKKIVELIKQNNWDNLPDEEKKIIAVEGYIKKNYSYNEDLQSDEGNSLESVLKNRTTGINGIMRLYNAVFQNLRVKYQIVLTGDRSKFIIDKALENWNNFDNGLFYFPTEGKFISPQRPDYRYPFIYPTWAATTGVFLKTTSIGSFTTAIAEVKDIELESYDKSYNNLDSHIEFTKSLDSLDIDSKQIFAGYEAVQMRDVFNFSNDDQKRNVTKELVKIVSGTDHILFSETLNKEFEDTKTPFILHSKTRSDNFIEKTGNKLLVKIGLAIGPQVEMYQEKPRQQAIDIDFGHIEERKIDFVIPDGYKINNADDLKLEQVYKDNGELTMGFVSTYEIKGNVLSINIREEYRKPYYPLSQFDQFKKIINTSSDFNKVVLVLEKK